MEGGYDPDNRRCFDWQQEHWDKEFMESVKKVLALRRDQTVTHGEIRIFADGDLFVLQRSDGDKKILFVANQSGNPISVQTEGTLFIGSRYDGGTLGTDGFLIDVRKGEQK